IATEELVIAALMLGVVNRLQRSDWIIPVQNVVTLVAIEAIAAASAVHEVTARAAVRDVVARAGRDRIVSRPGVDFVIAGVRGFEESGIADRVDAADYTVYRVVDAFRGGLERLRVDISRGD